MHSVRQHAYMLTLTLLLEVSMLDCAGHHRPLACKDKEKGLFEASVTAVVAISGEKNNLHVNGNVTFVQDAPDQVVQIKGTIVGLPPGKHGFHISQSGDMTGGCYVSGSHLNPCDQDHGAPTDKVRQVGSLGNIVADDDGVADIKFTDSVISLYPDMNFIIGRVLVIHESFDDLGRGDSPDSKKNGNAGGRLGCGVIGYK